MWAGESRTSSSQEAQPLRSGDSQGFCHPLCLAFVIWEHSDRVPKWLPNGHVETVTRMELDLHQGQGWWIKKLFLDAAGA